ncbi:thioredoxin family protein [Natronorubrum texcoconense]|uniref:Thioredoxin n=1 Tax=Natronorubrum texcoconense TaxID=1095776 RepID=A0A1G9FUR7_9EURY|nr:thioredoxin family protein [Natronorubrum texcoconense]SDK92082.1 Thioredoxin [Natronorubrum texcoconense]
MDETLRPTRLEDGADLDAFLEDRTVALVECYTSGCSKCQAMEPVLGNVARATGIPVGLVNPGDDLSLVDRFEIDSVPTLLCFENGREVGRLAEGFVGADAVVTFLEATVPGAVDIEAADT